MTGLKTADAARYVSEDFYRLESCRAFKRAWLVAGRESRIPNPGDHYTFEELEESVFIIRGQDRKVRTFHNMCSHRGTRLIQGTGNCKAIRCPYHDWKFNLEGDLKHVPAAEGFGGLDKSALGLAEIRTDVWGGFIWINFDENAPGLIDYLGELPGLLAPYELGQMRPFKERAYPLNCNWKAVQDNATECYHHNFVHKNSLAGHMDPNDLGFRPYGDHYRLEMPIAAYGWRKKLDAWCMPRGLDFTEEQKTAIHKYLIFPNTLLNILPTSLTRFTVWPDGPGACRLEYAFYTRRGERTISKARNLATFWISKILLDEDVALLAHYQKGLECGRRERHLLHDFEIGIAHFHDTLTRYVEGQKNPM